MIGRRGRRRATADAVRPVKVGTRIAFAPSASAMSQAAFDIAWPTSGFSLGLRDLVPVAETRLDGPRDPVHVRHRLDGILADRRLAREHHRGRAVEDRVRDVARLRARRLGRVDHRLEHLRRGDHRLPALERAQDDPLLEERHRDRARSRPRGRRARPSPRRPRAGCRPARRPPRPSRSSRSRARSSRPPRSASCSAARPRPSARTRARRSRRRARARTRGRRCPSASATGSAAERPAG